MLFLVDPHFSLKRAILGWTADLPIVQVALDFGQNSATLQKHV